MAWIFSPAALVTVSAVYSVDPAILEVWRLRQHFGLVEMTSAALAIESKGAFVQLRVNAATAAAAAHGLDAAALDLLTTALALERADRDRRRAMLTIAKSRVRLDPRNPAAWQALSDAEAPAPLRLPQLLRVSGSQRGADARWYRTSVGLLGGAGVAFGLLLLWLWWQAEQAAARQRASGGQIGHSEAGAAPVPQGPPLEGPRWPSLPPEESEKRGGLKGP